MLCQNFVPLIFCSSVVLEKCILLKAKKKKIVCLKALARVCEIGRFGQKLMREFFLFSFLFFKENLPVVR